MSGRVEGRRALVTGAASGIGRATAVRLAAEGARVALVDASQERLMATAREIGDAGLAIPTDVSQESAVTEALAAGRGRFLG